ncbi:MAG: LysE family translocator [Pseudomonadota bacterium]|jgi:RhtB (resistance to homoserine/threonine) family protein|nr:LysE family transporter [Alphaproteobacteria bacterium]
MFIEYLPSITTLLVLQVLGLISPGPDFAIVVRNSLIYSRKTAIFTAIGLALGVLVHLGYILLGLGVVITKTVWVFTAFKYIGASYLMYIGIKGIRAKKQQKSQEKNEKQQRDISPIKALSTGFLTNVTNPKAMLFFLSLISAFITQKEPTAIVITYALIIFSTTLVWFLIVAIFFSNKGLRSAFKNFQHIIERVTGSFLVLLGVKILFIK